MQDQHGVNPYAAPSARIESEQANAAELELAERGTRLLAVLIDAAMYAAIIMAAVIPVTLVAKPNENNDAVMIGLIVLMVLLIIGYLVVQCVQLHRTGQTLGKKWMGVRIVRTDGSRVGLGRIIAFRYMIPGVIGGIPLVGFLFTLADPLFIFADDRRTLHDKIADTIVVKA